MVYWPAKSEKGKREMNRKDAEAKQIDANTALMMMMTKEILEIIFHYDDDHSDDDNGTRAHVK